MKIELKKFGTTLLSRQNGREAFLAFLSTLNAIPKDEVVEVSFDGVITFSPSWGDEFLSKLFEKFDNKLVLIKTDNPSVLATIEMLEQVLARKFNWK
jgi:hypothetical protein